MEGTNSANHTTESTNGISDETNTLSTLVPIENKMIKLVSAIKQQDVPTAQKLITGMTNLNFKDPEENTPLFLAAKLGQAAIVELILNKQDPLISNYKPDRTPLHIACENNNVEVVKILLSDLRCQAFLNCSWSENDSLLNRAVKKSFADLVELLLKKTLSVNTEDKRGNTPLMNAILKNDVKIVTILLNDYRININCNCNKTSPIEHAIYENKSEIAKILLEKGARVPKKHDETGLTLFHHAVSYGMEEVVKLFIEKKMFDINSKTVDDSEKTALHIAVDKGFLELVKYLVTHGADVNAKNKRNSTPLHFAPLGWGPSELNKLNSLKIIDYLIKNGASVDVMNEWHYTPLRIALSCPDIQAAQILFDNGANIHDVYPNTHYARWGLGGTLLHWAARDYNGEEACKFLINNKIDINATENDGRTALCLAVKHHLSEEMLRFYIEHGAVLKNIGTGGAPLYWAFYIRDYKIAKLLIELMDVEGLNSNIDSWDHERRALHICEDAEIIKLLIQKGADVNIKDKLGNTPMHYSNSYIRTKLLQQAGGNVNALNNKKRTPLFYVDKLEIAEFLVENGAYVTIQDYKGSTPIHFSRNVQIAEFLVENGADLTFKNFKSETVLHTFAKLDAYSVTCETKTEIVDFYVKNGIDVNSHNKEGDTALHFAEMRSEREIVGSLLENGASLSIKNVEGKTPLDCDGWVIEDYVLKPINSTALLIEEGQDCKKKFIYVLPAVLTLPHLGEKKQCLIHLIAEKNKSSLLEHLLKMRNSFSPKGPSRLKFSVNVYDKNFWTPLHYAAFNSNLKIVKILLQNGAIYNSKTSEDKMPIDLATDPEVVEILQKVDQLFAAIKLENYDQIKELITQQPCIVNAKNHKETWSVLTWIVTKSFDLDLITTLLLHNVNVEDYVKGKKTWLHEAVAKNRIDIIEVLINKMNIHDKYYMKKFLNNKDKEGITALQISSQIGSLDIVKLLLRHGACYCPKTKDGRSPRDSSNNEIKQFLSDIGDLFYLAKIGSNEVERKLDRLSVSDDLPAVLGACDRNGDDILAALEKYGNKDIASDIKKFYDMIRPNSVKKAIKTKRNEVGNKTNEIESDNDSLDLGFGLFD